MTAEDFGSGQYFGGARPRCPVVTDTGWRWELDGVEIERGTQSPLGPGEVPVFADIQVNTGTGPAAVLPPGVGQRQGSACVTTA